MAEAFRVESWVYRGEIVDTNEGAIQNRLQSLIDLNIPGAGASWVLSSSGEEMPVVVMMTVGSDAWGRDFIDIDFSRAHHLPALSYFRRSIELCRPTEAFIIDNKNEDDLQSQERQRRFPNFERPAIVRWFHYLGRDLVQLLGGIEYCLRTPAFKTEQFCGGILLQLTEEPFDAASREHQECQLQAMRFLGLE